MTVVVVGPGGEAGPVDHGSMDPWIHGSIGPIGIGIGIGIGTGIRIGIGIGVGIRIGIDIGIGIGILIGFGFPYGPARGLDSFEDAREGHGHLALG